MRVCDTPSKAAAVVSEEIRGKPEPQPLSDLTEQLG